MELNYFTGRESGRKKESGGKRDLKRGRRKEKNLCLCVLLLFHFLSPRFHGSIFWWCNLSMNELHLYY